MRSILSMISLYILILASKHTTRMGGGSIKFIFLTPQLYPHAVFCQRKNSQSLRRGLFLLEKPYFRIVKIPGFLLIYVYFEDGKRYNVRKISNHLLKRGSIATSCKCGVILHDLSRHIMICTWKHAARGGEK